MINVQTVYKYTIKERLCVHDCDSEFVTLSFKVELFDTNQIIFVLCCFYAALSFSKETKGNLLTGKFSLLNSRVAKFTRIMNHSVMNQIL